jgi:hypothetical protein
MTHHIFRRTSLKERLLATLELYGGEYRGGICKLSEEIDCDRFSTRRSLRLLVAEEEITIIPGAPGRGNAAIIKVNA